MSFKSYVISKGIHEFSKCNYNIDNKKEYDYESICEHVNVIWDFHNRLKGCSIPKYNMLNKMVEDFKVSEKILIEDLNKYQYNFKNEFEENVLKFGDKVLNRIQKILNVIHSNNYENLILRSIKFREYCVYNTSLNEIYTNNTSIIFIKSIDDICENILEYDYIKFFTKLKRSKVNLDFFKCCAYVCGKEMLDVNSYNFMLACISFPYEFIKVVSKYRDLGGEFGEYYSNLNFDNVLIKDGESFV